MKDNPYRVILLHQKTTKASLEHDKLGMKLPWRKLKAGLEIFIRFIS
jgi:hypothetical protein